MKLNKKLYKQYTHRKSTNHNFKEMKARGNMVRFLTQALGISGEINYGEESVSRMVKLYEEKLKDGTLTSDNIKILDLEEFNKFRKKIVKILKKPSKSVTHMAH